VLIEGAWTYRMPARVSRKLHDRNDNLSRPSETWPGTKRVVTWGLSDRYSWLAKSRRDHLPSRPLPFDAHLAPKPAFEAMAPAFANAAQRQAD
jgi:GH35 family endo-1,4-beta-xylanase